MKRSFDDGQEQEIDFRPVLAGQLFAPLQDEKLFNQVEIDPEIHTLVWPNGADFDPETLHDWPKYVDDLARLVRQSGRPEAGRLGSEEAGKRGGWEARKLGGK